MKQVRKRKTNILSLYMKSRKMVLMNLFAGKDWRKEVQEGGDIYILMADSLCFMAETNTIL